MSDYISREEAINSVYDGTSYDVLTEECKRHIEEVPSAFEGMTNGEVIQALFPNPHIETKSHKVWVGYDGMSFTREWWNAPYQKGGKE